MIIINENNEVPYDGAIMWTILIFYFYADNLKVSTIVSCVSINFFFEKWFKFCVKIGFEVENLC